MPSLWTLSDCWLHWQLPREGQQHTTRPFIYPPFSHCLTSKSPVRIKISMRIAKMLITCGGGSGSQPSSSAIFRLLRLPLWPPQVTAAPVKLGSPLPPPRSQKLSLSQAALLPAALEGAGLAGTAVSSPLPLASPHPVPNSSEPPLPELQPSLRKHDLQQGEWGIYPWILFITPNVGCTGPEPCSLYLSP